MKLNYKGLADKDSWHKAGISLPSYNPEELAAKTRNNPRWVHFGIGNIFRIFIGGIADKLINSGLLDRGITCIETFDYDVVDKIYRPFDNLALAVTLYGDGHTDKRVLGSLSESIKSTERPRMREIFSCPDLQLVSYTITEKGYSLRDSEGKYLSYAANDMNNGPEKSTGAMAVTTAMLYERFKAGAYPLALVSMDNVSHNGEKLMNSVIETAEQWQNKKFVPPEFIAYLKDSGKIAFNWTMIDKITPRPSDEVGKMLGDLGVENMQTVITSKKTYIAPFVNAEEPQYLVIEDKFPNGRPEFEKADAGVYMTDRKTVNLSERMKVTACLNPIHTALCTYDCMLGYKLFADGMHDKDLSELARQVGYIEGLPVVEDPKILSPKKFIDEVINIRFPNPYLGDTSARIAVDISQMVGIRFGETIKAHIAKFGTAEKLNAIPLAIAGWLRYLLAVDDNREKFELSPDPMIPELTSQLSSIKFGRPESFDSQLRPILSNANIFGVNLYEAGLGEKIESIFRDQISGVGAVRAALKKYLYQ
ncbi:MAG: mannitol dehydrogenase family protein [Synergistaceae bacterium]|nr:mannitol dehydrogenase family protein [Synergistaceae bacterium]